MPHGHHHHHHHHHKQHKHHEHHEKCEGCEGHETDQGGFPHAPPPGSAGFVPPPGSGAYPEQVLPFNPYAPPQPGYPPPPQAYAQGPPPQGYYQGPPPDPNHPPPGSAGELNYRPGPDPSIGTAGMIPGNPQSFGHDPFANAPIPGSGGAAPNYESHIGNANEGERHHKHGLIHKIFHRHD